MNTANNVIEENLPVLDTIILKQEEGVLFADINVPPMNLFGPSLASDLAALMQYAEADKTIKVVVFRSSNPDYFISHVDITRIKENREAIAKLNGLSYVGQFLRYLSTSRLVTIAQIEGRVRGVGSEFVLACDMRFAAIESAIFNQFEPAFGVIPGSAAAQHLVRLMGRARAIEVLLSAEDYNAELAERYGWINRALPANEINDFVRSMALRIARFPAAGHAVVKERINAIGLPPIEDFQKDFELFIAGVGTQDYQDLMQAAMKHGFQTPEAELDLARMLGDLAKISS